MLFIVYDCLKTTKNCKKPRTGFGHIARAQIIPYLRETNIQITGALALIRTNIMPRSNRRRRRIIVTSLAAANRFTSVWH